jgi:hypothetical protein
MAAVTFIQLILSYQDLLIYQPGYKQGLTEVEDGLNMIILIKILFINYTIPDNPILLVL